MGIVMTDMDTKSRYQKLFNLTVRGRCRVFNCWTTASGPNTQGRGKRPCDEGRRALFDLEKGSLGRQQALYATGRYGHAYLSSMRQHQHDLQISASRRSLTASRRPQIKDEDGNLEQHIYVGKVLSAISKKPDEHYQKRSFREHVQLAALPMLESAVHTGCKNILDQKFKYITSK